MKVIELAKNVRNGECLRYLYKCFKDRKDVVLEISKNPATPMDVLANIAVSCEDYHDPGELKMVYEAAKRTQNPELLRHFYNVYKGEPKAEEILLRNPCTPADVLTELIMPNIFIDPSGSMC